MTDGEILVVGEALIDVVRGRDGSVVERVGGSPLNVAVGLGRLGHAARLLTTVGADEHGAAIRSHLQRSGVALTAAESERTSTATAEITADGSARYEFDIAWDLPETETSGVRILHTGSLGAALAPGDAVVLALLQRARESALISFDPNIRPALMRPLAEQRAHTERFFALADVVKLSDEDAEWLYPGMPLDDVLKRILELGPRLVAVTRGGAGAVLRTLTLRVEQDADSEGIVDTIGAGDSFMAGLLHGLAGDGDRSEQTLLRGDAELTESDLVRIGSIASRCAAITVRRPGADLPWLHELPPAPTDGHHPGSADPVELFD